MPGVITRRYHGLLIAALPAPLGRIVMLSHVAEQLTLADGRCVEIGGRERSGDAPDAHGTGYLAEFRLEAGLPVWRYDVEGLVIEKRLFLPHMQNTVHLSYELLSGADSVELALRPSVNFRAQESPVSEPLGWPYEFRAVAGALRDLPDRTVRLPPLRIKLSATDTAFTLKSTAHRQRAVSGRGEPRLPGARRSVEPGLRSRLTLHANQPATLIASTETIETMSVMPPAAAARRRARPAAAPARARRSRAPQDGIAAELVLAADQFIIDAGRAHARNRRARTPPATRCAR